jgi:hypothetical protein
LKADPREFEASILLVRAGHELALRRYAMQGNFSVRMGNPLIGTILIPHGD